MLLSTLSLSLVLSVPVPQGTGPSTPHPILFVTQVPHAADFTTIGSTFGNHLPSIASVPRGGDLWIRYSDGSLRNLTAAAGLGASGLQGANAIAVRDPCVHWDGNKALISLLVGAVEGSLSTWQIYEVQGFGPGQTPVVTKVPFQPSDYNNVSPIYASDDRVLFTSDRPRDGGAHLFPQLDEYEMAPTVTGLWSLDPVVGDLFQMTASPSGDFTPLVDSFGRVVFTRWDHLQQDQLDALDEAVGNNFFNVTDHISEEPGAPTYPEPFEVFPEVLPFDPDASSFPGLNGHQFNHFFPWMIHQDGSELETLNHVGRHELHSYFDRSFTTDSNLTEFIAGFSGSVNPNRILNLFQISEDPLVPGRYLGVFAPEFDTHASGQLVAVYLPEGSDPDDLVVEFLTHPDTASQGPLPGPGHTGHYRDPVALSNGELVAAHADQNLKEPRVGGCNLPASIYDFRLRTVVPGPGGFGEAGQSLTAGVFKSVQWTCGGVPQSYAGPLWELQPVEVVVRPRPANPSTPLPSLEQTAFDAAAVSPAALRNWLYQNGLALLVTRDVTSRDDADRQQPFNLSVPGGTQTVSMPGKVYETSHLQFFQGDYRRERPGKPGRRVLSTPLHDGLEFMPALVGAPEASVEIASDGSMAAFVPARRALTWQLTDHAGEPVVRERVWLSFQPGEVVSCASCHGLNDRDQLGQFEPTNVPLALIDLLDHWKTLPKPPGSLTGPLLGPAAAGTIGLSSGQPGAPFDILHINGSSGGMDRRVDVGIGQSFTLDVQTPSGSASPVPFLLWGFIGVPSEFNVFDTFLGSFAFPPSMVAPSVPGFFAAAAGATGFSGTLPQGVAFPLAITYQGVVFESAPGAQPISITNAIVLNVL